MISGKIKDQIVDANFVGIVLTLRQIYSHKCLLTYIYRVFSNLDPRIIE